MKASNKILLAVVLVIVTGLGAFLASRQDSPGDKKNTTTQSTAEAAAVITYSDNGFTTSVDHVKSGDTIKVVNQSSEDLDFASDPHPVHTDDPELNAGLIASGQSKSFVVQTKGDWGFHNHLKSGDKDSIKVE